MHEIVNSLQSALLGCPAGLLALCPAALIAWLLSRVLGKHDRQRVMDKARQMQDKRPKRGG